MRIVALEEHYLFPDLVAASGSNRLKEDRAQLAAPV